MDQPLALTAGNAVEVAEVMDCLTGRAITQPLWDLTVALGGALLALAGRGAGRRRGEAAVAEALSRGPRRRALRRDGGGAWAGRRISSRTGEAHLPQAPVDPRGERAGRGPGGVRSIPAPSASRWWRSAAAASATAT